MPVDASYQPDPVFQSLGEAFADPVLPADFPACHLRFWNARAAASVGLAGLTPGERTAHFCRFQSLPGNQGKALALRYHGHQFQVYNPDLGDGRGFLFAQLRETASGRLLDLGTKGSGQTPWSRAGDGRLTLKGAVREALATAMLEALGVPTSRTFAIFETGEALTRSDEPSPTRGGVLTRLSYSHIRFGTFQRLAVLEKPEPMRQLLDHACAVYYPEVAAGEMRAGGFLARVVAKVARLTARWMAAGFVHGVLNTDNMNINGESFDYGPYRFLPRNDPNFVAAYFDHAGLYSFGRQPEAVFWNLRQLAGALSVISASESLVDALNMFSGMYRDELKLAMLNRLGVTPFGDDRDLDLVNAAFRALAGGGERLRWEPFFFDWFGGLASEERALAGPRADLYQEEGSVEFRRLLAPYSPVRIGLLHHRYFGRAEPEELLYEEIEALWAAIALNDDWSPFDAKIARVDEARAAWGLEIQA